MSEVSEARHGDVSAMRPYERLVQSLQAQAEAGNSADRGFDITANQVDKIAMAENADDVLSAPSGGTIAMQNLQDVELEISDFVVIQSGGEFEASLGVYIVADAVRLDTGEQIAVNTGAPIPISQLQALKNMGAFPVTVVVKGTTTRAGNTVLKLAKPPARVVTSSKTSK